MEHHNTQRPKRLKNFLLNVLETGSCLGVEWINKSEGEFKIDWYDIKKINPKDIEEKFKIFIDWALFTGNYKIGDKPEYSLFKTRLRTALTKLEDFIETTKEENKKQFRSYKFKNWNSENSGTMSPDSTVVFDEEPLNRGQHHHQAQLLNPRQYQHQAQPLNLGQYQHQVQFCQSLTTQAEKSQLPSFLQEDPVTNDSGQIWRNAERNLPNIQTDILFSGKKLMLISERCSASTSNLNAIHPLESYQFPKQEGNQTTLLNMQPNHTSQDILQEAMNMSDITETPTNVESDPQKFVSRHANMPMSSTNPIPGAYTESHDETDGFKDLLQFCTSDQIGPNMFTDELTGNTSPLPLDLQNIPFHCLLQLPITGQNAECQRGQNMGVSSEDYKDLPADESKEMDVCKGLPCEEEWPKALPLSKYLGSPSEEECPGMSVKKLPDLPKMEECTSISLKEHPHLQEKKCKVLSDDAHGMQILLFYGRPKTLVKEWTVSARGCRLYFGEKVFDTAFSSYGEMYGPKTVEQLEMPPVELLQEHDEKIKKNISQALDGISRGLILTFQDGDIYADRKSLCKIFAMDTLYNSQPLARAKESPQKVFDYELFNKSFEKGPKRKPFFILTFGRKINIDPQKPFLGSLDNALVYAFVYHKKALEKSQVENPGQENFSSLDELTLSDVSPMDQLEQIFRKMKT